MDVRDSWQTEIQQMATSAGQASEIGSVAPHRLHPGLMLLLDAHSYATELKRNVWDFAVEIPGLRTAGLTETDFRWLVCKGYVEHACETTLPGEDGREFEPGGNLTFTRQTCFVLTEAGVHIAKQTLQQSVHDHADGLPLSRSVQRVVAGNGHRHRVEHPHGFLSGVEREHVQPQTPKWDPDRHELRLNDLLVKVFKLPSPNQEMVLMAFQEEGWPPRVDNPLPPALEIDPKQRLHDTIKSLNRRQKNRLIRFMGDGTGEGVRWELFLQS